MPQSARVKLEPQHVESKVPRLSIGRLPCRSKEPRISERRDRTSPDTRTESDGQEKFLCQSLRISIESAMLPNRTMRAASRLLGLLEARQSLRMTQAIDTEVLQTVHHEISLLLSLHSGRSPNEKLRYGLLTLSPREAKCGDFGLDELFSEEPWDGCEDIAAEELFDWFNESLQPYHPLPPATVRLRPVVGVDYEKLGSARVSSRSVSTASTTSGVGRLSTASMSLSSTNSLEGSFRASICESSRSSVLSSMRGSDAGADLHSKSVCYSKQDEGNLHQCARSVVCPANGKSWQQMWHQRLFCARSALSARGERSDHLRELRGLSEDRFLNDVG